MCLWKIQKNPLQRIICDRCGVEVEKKVRRDRVGHINLVVPIAHIWYFRSLPNKIGYILVFHLRN
jgi:DNA-directed RNA polymerase subunit beta'